MVKRIKSAQQRLNWRAVGNGSLRVCLRGVAQPRMRMRLVHMRAALVVEQQTGGVPNARGSSSRVSVCSGLDFIPTMVLFGFKGCASRRKVSVHLPPNFTYTNQPVPLSIVEAVQDIIRVCSCGLSQLIFSTSTSIAFHCLSDVSYGIPDARHSLRECLDIV